MVVGAVTVVVWAKLLSGGPLGIFDLYEILPGFLLALLVAWVVSRATFVADPEVDAEFTEAARLAKVGGSVNMTPEERAAQAARR